MIVMKIKVVQRGVAPRAARPERQQGETSMRSAVRGGAFVGALVAGLVLLLAVVPALARGYPLALLPLLAAGPVSVQSGPRRVDCWLLRGFVAGLVAAVIAVV